MKGCMQWNPVYELKRFPPPAGPHKLLHNLAACVQVFFGRTNYLVAVGSKQYTGYGKHESRK